MVVKGVAQPLQTVANSSTVVVAVQPKRVVFSLPDCGPCVLVRRYWPLGGKAAAEVIAHGEPDQVSVGTVVHGRESAPVAFMVG